MISRLDKRWWKGGGRGKLTHTEKNPLPYFTHTLAHRSICSAMDIKSSGNVFPGNYGSASPRQGTYVETLQ